MLPRLGGVRLTELGPADLNRLYGELLEGSRKRGGGLSPRTVRYVHTILHRALRDAARWGWVPRNVADLADPPRVARVEMAIWQPAQLRAFLTHVADDRLYAMRLLFATTGMRRGEVAGLAWLDVDLDDGRLTVRQHRTKVGRHGRVVTGEPKGGREHTIALDGVTVAALRDHRRRQAAERLAWGAGWDDAGLVFIREDGTPLHPDAISSAFKRHIRDAGLPRIRPHDLRHSSSACLDAGVPVEVLSKRLGHASPNITREIYVHVLPKHDEQVAEAMATAILGGPGLTREAR